MIYMGTGYRIYWFRDLPEYPVKPGGVASACIFMILWPVMILTQIYHTKMGFTAKVH